MKQINLFSNAVILFSALTLGCLDTASGARALAKPPVPDFTQGGKIPEGAKHDRNLGATGLRGWMFCDTRVTSDARQIAITKVEKGSPADGVLAVGDAILGVGGKPFSYDPRTEFGKALTAAEAGDYGTHAKAAIPELTKIAHYFEKEEKDFPPELMAMKAKSVRDTIAAIEASTDSPGLIRLK